jgi:GrpB-like predicted nucleotidyltransferase (UPF0157 family)
MVDPHDDPIELVEPAHERWRAGFERERDRIDATLEAAELADAVERIEHVGSTAVPGLAAKDIVDLDLVVELALVASIAGTIASELGGDRYENDPTWHPVFRRADGQRFNDHVFARSSDRWKVSVVTRDVLRAHPELRDAYERRKRDLAGETDDLGTYGRGKTDIVERILDRGRSEPHLTYSFEVPVLD